MKVNGKMITDMGLALRFLRIVVSTQASTTKEELMEKVLLCGIMESHTRVNGLKVRSMAKECGKISKEVNMMALGTKIKVMATVCTLGQTEISISGIGTKI